MQLEIIRTLPHWLALGEEWNDLLARSVVRVHFLRHEFLTAWWARLGGCNEWPHGDLYVVLAREGGRLVAAAPLFSSVDREGCPVLALIGSDAMADYLDVLAEPEFLVPFVSALLDHLTTTDPEPPLRASLPDAPPPWRSLDLFNLRDDSPTRNEFCRAAAARGLTTQQTVLDFKGRFGAHRRNVHCLRLFPAGTAAPPGYPLAGGERPLGEAIDNSLLAAGLGAETIIQRGELPAMSSENCEIVTCRMIDGCTRRLFCKYGRPASGYPEETAGPTHRFGLGYEARAYDELLPAWMHDVPPLHGVFLDESSQILVLALDYLEGGTPLHQVWQPKADLGAAARWIARFHRWGETAAVPAFLRRYDTEFYRTRLHRAAECTRRLHPRYPWLPSLCERGLRRLPALLPPATIIHGEYQANNILVHRARTMTADWESVALAAGEIDLANLTWGWEDDVALHCERQYSLARWPDGEPDDFAMRLAAARVFVHLRWLGDAEAEEDLSTSISALDQLAPLAERFAALDGLPSPEKKLEFP